MFEFIKDRYYQIALAFLALAVALTSLLLLFFEEEFSGTLLPELIGFCLEGAVFLGIANAIIKHRESVRRKEHLRVAFYPVRNALIAYCNVLFHMKKATANEPGQNGEVDILEFLDTLDAERFVYIPLGENAPVAPSNAASISWHEYLRASTLDFKNAVDKALDRYITLLEAPQSKALEDIANDSCIKSIDMSVAFERTQSNQGFPGTGMAIFAFQFRKFDDRGSSFDNLLSRIRVVAEICVKYCDEPVTVSQNWAANVAPKTGEAFSRQSERA